jgi:hypothetical protein
VLSEDVPQQQQQQANMDEVALLVAQMGVTVADLLGGADLPKAIVARKCVHGQPLVSKERYRDLSTHMQNLHDWYMLASKDGQTMLMAKVTEEYYFCVDEIYIEFLELFQSMNQDALDKSLISKFFNSFSISCSILSVH